MPEEALAYAGRVIGLAAGFLLPVVALLFVALRLRRRVSYPHGLLLSRGDEAKAAALFRRLRPYLDAAIDASMAVVIAFALAGAPPWAARRSGVAAAIDASASMAFGSLGDRPIDAAARLILSDPSLADAELYILSWDPESGVHGMRDSGKSLEGIRDPVAFARAVEGQTEFFSADLRLAGALAAKGYARVVVITDDGGAVGDGVEIAALSRGPSRYLYPASSKPAAEGWATVGFVASGGAGPEGVYRIDDEGRLVRAKPERFAVKADPAGFELRLADPGLWAVEWDGRMTPFWAPFPTPSATSDGPLSERIVAALGLAADGRASPGRGSARGDRGLAIRDGSRTGDASTLYVSIVEDDGLVLPPRLTLGRPVAAGASSGIALGPAGLASEEAALPFALAAASVRIGPCSTPALSAAGGPRGESPRFPFKGRSPIRVGEGFVYLGGPSAGASPVVLPPIAEYAAYSRSIGSMTEIVAEPKPDRRALVAAALVILLAAKYLLFRSKRR